MELTGAHVIPVAQQRVWEALNDPAVLQACIPGCESIEKTSDAEFALAMLAAVGPVKARFKGTLVIGDAQPPDRYVLSFNGSGGAAGFGKGSAAVSLAPVSAGTELTYVANAQIGGKIAQVGSRLVDGVARQMASTFFERFNALLTAESVKVDVDGAPSSLESAPPDAADVIAAPPAAAPAPPAQPIARAVAAAQPVGSTPAAGQRWMWWVAALIAIACIAYLLSRQ